MFEVRNISFSYSRPVLRDVSFVASPGETVSILGANGAGKTTLFRILATLTVPDSGMVLSDGQNAFTAPLKYRRQLGYLPERTALYEDMTVKEYLMRKKLTTAATLLESSSMTVSEIAEQLNFSSLHAFGQAFRRYMGASPSQYRQQSEEAE